MSVLRPLGDSVQRKPFARLTVRVTPRGGRDAVEGWQGDTLLVRVAAAPADGQANASLLRLIARTLGVAPSRIQIVAGGRTRQKRLSIEGLTQAELEARLGVTLRQAQAEGSPQER